MNQPTSDTIAAISTPLGEGGIGVIRISGPESALILSKIFVVIEPKNNGFIPHYLYHGRVLNFTTKEQIDDAMAGYMQAPKSYTGEDVVEISCHGGITVLRNVLEQTLNAGARLAEKGEFTKRAFLNGKIDLAQAEAVIDLIKAPTREGAGVAFRQLEGQLSNKIKELRGRLILLLSGIEANLDFPDEIDEINRKEAGATIKKLIEEISRLLSTAEAGRILREGLSTVIIGRPNVGKSSLLNALLKEERAIVTDMPGTTRDTIEERVLVKGIFLKIIDTAGLRHPKDKAEEAGVERTRVKLALAELVLLVIDATEGITEEDEKLLRTAEGKKVILVVNKIDLLKTDISTPRLPAGRDKRINGYPHVYVSALTGQGVADLEEAIVNLVAAKKVAAGNEPILTRIRHKECLERAKEALKRTQTAVSNRLASDFLAIDLKDAIIALGEVTGEEASEEVINRIFEEFCVGK